MKYFVTGALALLASALELSAEPKDLKNWIESKSEKTSHQLRRSGGSYLREIEYVTPSPSTNLDALLAINPALATLLPGLEGMFKDATVSPRYEQLQSTKTKYLRAGTFPTTHNFYDCETFLQLTHPETGRKVLWLQADMDVVTDGSDPDRAPLLADYDLARTSNSFLPFTKFGWPKSSSTPENPFVDYYAEVLTELEKVKALLNEKAANDKGIIWRELLATCDQQIKYAKSRGPGTHFQTWTDERRYVVATLDPFVVLPNSWLNGGEDWTPAAGNYAAVIYRDTIYPAILGDTGPESIVGEASLKLAQTLNPSANGRVRAVNELAVSYLIFPGTRAPAAEPDLALWRVEISRLLGELGGVSPSENLHTW
jgi:Fungal chitosanase of glycosyl hydrolase group 75